MQSFSAGKQQVTCQHTNSIDVHRSFLVNASFATVLALWLHWTTNTVHWIKKEVRRETLGSSDFSSYIFGFKKTTRKQNLQDCFWSAFFNKLLFFFLLRAWVVRRFDIYSDTQRCTEIFYGCSVFTAHFGSTLGGNLSFWVPAAAGSLEPAIQSFQSRLHFCKRP